MSEFKIPADELAVKLLGSELLVQDSQGERGGIIIETESYTSDDPTSHSYKGQNTRNSSMYLAPGTLYLYRIYGIHICLNIVCGKHDGQAVLIRSLVPTRGISFMQKKRKIDYLHKLLNGPANVVKALNLSMNDNGTHINDCHVQLNFSATKIPYTATKRIGITKGTEYLRRFIVKPHYVKYLTELLSP